MDVVCDPIRMGRWSELMVVCVCHSDDVMREDDANDTSGELGSALPGSLEGERTASGRLVVNNAHCRNWPGDVHVGNEQLCIIHIDADGQFF